MTPRRLRDGAAFEAWLEAHHASADEVWLVIAKKHAKGLHLGDALDAALCFGWSDELRHAEDEDTIVQGYSSRRLCSCRRRRRASPCPSP